MVIQGKFPHGRPVFANGHQAAGQHQVRQPAMAVPNHGLIQPQMGDVFQLPPHLCNFGNLPGKPLPKAVQRKMESFFKTNFSDVRVHIGPQAASIGALAFTQGNNLYFAPGQYNPTTLQGQQLLGHELAHVVQQRRGRVRNPFGLGVAVVQDRSMESEADRMGTWVSHRPMSLKPPDSRQRTPAILQGNFLRVANPGTELGGLGIRAGLARLLTEPVAPAHISGHLEYGMSPARIAATNDDLEEHNADYKTIDNLNDKIGLMDKWESVADPFAAYQGVMGFIQGFPDKIVTTNTVPNVDVCKAWKAFLKCNIKYVDLEKTVQRTIKDTSNKDLKKNILGSETMTGTWDNLRELLRRSWDQKSMYWFVRLNPNTWEDWKDLAKTWLMTAFFRRTCKLGMQFAKAFGIPITFTIDTPEVGNTSLQLPGLVARTNSSETARYRAITESEYRFASRSGVTPFYQETVGTNWKPSNGDKYIEEGKATGRRFLPDHQNTSGPEGKDYNWIVPEVVRS